MEAVRVLCGMGLAVAAVVLCASIPGRLSRPGAAPRSVPALRDAELDHAEQRIRTIETRIDSSRGPVGLCDPRVVSRIIALERRLASHARPAADSAIVDPIPATHDALVERARARGTGPLAAFENWPAVLADEIAAWEAAAARAADEEARVRAWSELERLYSMAGNHEALNFARLNILETTGLGDESAWKRARLLANSVWGNGDIAVASDLFREAGRASELPKEVAIGFRMQAAQLAVAGKEPAAAMRLHREFIRDYEGDPDPMVMQRVAAMRRELAALESRHPELRQEE